MFKWVFKQPANQSQPPSSPKPVTTTQTQKAKAKPRANEPSEADLATLELLQAAETYPILVLMLPKLVRELKQRLSEIDREQGAIASQLQELYTRRNDILPASSSNTPSSNRGDLRGQILQGPTASRINPANNVETKQAQKEGVAA